MNGLSLFSGIGGIDLGLSWAIPGYRTVCHVERNPYSVGVLVQLMEAGNLEPAPIWDDVRTFDGKPWRGKIDIISGGFPCQDISTAGKGAEIVRGKTRSGLWHEFERLIGEIRPRFVLVENVRALLVRGLDTVLGSLAAIGYDAEWRIISAESVGAPHRRERIFIVAHARGTGRQQKPGSTPSHESTNEGRTAQKDHLPECDGESRGKQNMANAKGAGKSAAKLTGQRHGTEQSSSNVANPDEVLLSGTGRARRRRDEPSHDGEELPDADRKRLKIWDWRKAAPRPWLASPQLGDWWQIEPDVGRVAHGISFRVERLAALGNAVVPQAVEEAARKMILPFLFSQ